MKKTISIFLIILTSITLQATEADIKTTKDNKKQEKTYFHDRIYSLQEESEETKIRAEIQFGRNLAARILGKYKLSDNQAVSDYVAKIGTGIASQMGRSEIQYYFAVIESDEINAFACPGGYIFITTGTIAKMKTEAELVGVLSHEVSHVNRKHVLKKINFSVKSQSTISEFGSIIGASSQTAKLLMEKLLDEALSILFETGLDSDDELESDIDAVSMMVALNYEWSEYQRFIGKLETHKEKEEDHSKTHSKTHPKPNERVKTMTNYIANLAYKVEKGRSHENRFSKFTSQ